MAPGDELLSQVRNGFSAKSLSLSPRAIWVPSAIFLAESHSCYEAAVENQPLE